MECAVFLLFLFNLATVAFFLWRNSRLAKSLHAEIAELRAQLGLPAVPAPDFRATQAAAPPPPAPAPPVSPAAAVPAAPPSPVQPAPSPVASAPATVPPAAPAPQPAVSLSRPPAPAPRPAVPATPPPPAKAARPSPIPRWFSESHLVVRAGIVVLFVGIAFLLRYAAEQGWFTIELRLVSAWLLGVVLISGGWYLRDKRRIYALTLQGGGLGIAYLTTFAAYRLYELIPDWLSLIVMVALGVLSAGLAIANNAQSLAGLAVTGGFLAPILTGDEGGSHVVLFTYFTLLNVAILAIAWFKSWRSLNLVGFTFTFVLASLWGAGAYQPENFATVEPFLILFFLFYVAIGILYAVRQPPDRLGLVDGALVFGTPIIAFIWQTALVRDIENGLGWSALALGVFYLALAAVFFVRSPAPFMLLREIYLALGMVFTLLAVPLTYADTTTAAIWAVAGAGLLWSGIRQNRPFSTFLGGLVQLGAAAYIAFARVWYLLQGVSEAAATADARAIGAGLVAVSALASGYFMLDGHRRGRRWLLKSDLGVLHIFTTLWGLLWWLGTGFSELRRLLPADFDIPGTMILFWVTSAILGELVGRGLRWTAVRAWGFVLWAPLGLAALGVATLDATPLLSRAGWVAWPLGLATHFWILRSLDDAKWARAGHPIGLWLVSLVGTLALTTALPDLGLATWTTAAGIVVPALLVLLVVTQRERPTWPFTPHAALYLNIGALPLLLLMVLWTLGVNLSNPGPDAPLPYLPVLNALSIAQLLVFATGFAWLAYAHRQFGSAGLLRGGRVVALWLAILWGSAEMARTAHHYYQVPFSLRGILDTPALLTAYSIAWTLSAMCFMVLGNRRGVRWLWLTGAALLGLTVLKLFTVDLAGADTLARIISFIVVGLLMLLIGYIAPIPSAAKAPASAGDSGEAEPPAAAGAG